MSPLARAAWLAFACTAAGGCGQETYNLDGGDDVTVGKLYVDKRGCASCHQSANAADGVLSGQSTPVPGTSTYESNLTSDVATGLGAWADIEIVRAMRYGFDRDDIALCLTMPHDDGADGGATFMTDLEADAIVAYLRSLPSVKRTDIPGSVCPPVKFAPVDMTMPPPDDLSGTVTDAAPDGQTDGQIDALPNGLPNGLTDGSTDGPTAGSTDGPAHAPTDGPSHDLAHDLGVAPPLDAGVRHD